MIRLLGSASLADKSLMIDNKQSTTEIFTFDCTLLSFIRFYFALNDSAP